MSGFADPVSAWMTAAVKGEGKAVGVSVAVDNDATGMLAPICIDCRHGCTITAAINAAQATRAVPASGQFQRHVEKSSH